jgi:amino acid transporter
LAEKKTFPKNVSSLVRDIGPVTAVLIIVANTVGLGWQYRLFQSTGLTPLPENLWFGGIPPAVMSFIIGGIIILLIMLGYSILITAMPRSGGGYVAISRILGPFPAFIGAWFEFFAVAMDLGIIAVVVFEMLFLNLGPGSGYFAVPTTYNDVGFLAGGVLLIVLTTAIVALGVRITGYVLQVLVWVPAVLGVYVFYLLGVAILNPATLQSGIAAWAQAQGVSGVTAGTYVKAALAQGLDSASVGNYWTAVSASLLFAYFAYTGYAALTFVAGEVKEPNRNLTRILLIVPLIIMIMYVTMAVLGSYAAAGVGQITLPNGDRWSFLEAYSYLSYGAGSIQQAGVPNIPLFITTLASMVGIGVGLGSLNILLLIFGLMWIINDLPAFALIGSRLIFAMSFDRMLPASLCKVNRRFHSPIYAVVLVGIFALLGALSETCIVCYGGSWAPAGAVGSVLTNVFGYGFSNVDLMDAVFFSLFALAVVLFPFRLKRNFDTATFKPGGKVGVVAIGLAGLIANLIIAWLMLTSPYDVYNILAPNSYNWFTLGFTGLLGLIGCLIYAYYRYRPQAKEMDYSVIFSTIPPE